MIERRRLHDRLNADVQLRLLRAPIGFGKTTLVQQWLDTRTAPDEVVAAVRVRPGGGDADSFWVAVTEALVDAGLSLPALSQNRSWQSLAERMITAVRHPLLLWIDNFENVTVPADLVLLDLLVHTPNLQLVVGVRGHRHFADHLLGNLDSTTVTPKDLLFTATETGQLLGMAGLDLSQDDLDDIHEASGGWPEPTRTFALAVGSSAGGTELAITGHRVAADWLQHRLLPEGTEADLIEFALSTTLPDELTVGLAEALSDDPSARSHLETLSEYGVLFKETCTGEPVYRWPSAARGALDSTLRQRTPERLPELYTRLASWYIDNNRSADALRCALQADDSRLVVEVIERSWRELLMYHHRDLHDALVSVPLETIASSDRAMAVRDIWLGGSDERLIAGATLPANDIDLNRLVRGGRVRDVLDTGLAIMIALRRRGLFDHAGDYARRLLKAAAIARGAHPEQITGLVPSVQLAAGQTLLLADDLASALEPLHRTYDSSADADFDYIAPDAAASLALSHAMEGRTNAAITWLDRYSTNPAPPTWLRQSIEGKARVVRLLLALDMLDLETAASQVGNDPLDERLGAHEWWAFGVWAHTRQALHAGTMLDALELIDRSRELFKRWLGHGATAGPLLALAEVDLLLALGRGNQARSILQGQYKNHPLLRIGQARLALLAGQNAVALRLAADPAWQRGSTTRHRHEMLLIHAIAAHRTGDLTAAVYALKQAVASTHATAVLRPFTTVPRGELAALAAHVPAVSGVLTNPAVIASRDLFPHQIQLIELTRREQQVLEKIAAGLSIHQVATALRVSYSTVRTQQRSMYRKLQAESQFDAVTRARQSGLLSGTLLAK